MNSARVNEDDALTPLVTERLLSGETITDPFVSEGVTKPKLKGDWLVMVTASMTVAVAVAIMEDAGLHQAFGIKKKPADNMTKRNDGTMRVIGLVPYDYGKTISLIITENK